MSSMDSLSANILNLRFSSEYYFHIREMLCMKFQLCRSCLVMISTGGGPKAKIHFGIL